MLKINNNYKILEKHTDVTLHTYDGKEYKKEVVEAGIIAECTKADAIKVIEGAWSK